LRIALGAPAGNIMRLVLGQGMKLVALGVGLGLLGAACITSWLASLLYGVSATDPLTFTSIALVSVIVATVACWIPARRATKVDPLIALKYE
jgi:putative ABC transport system permease protein